MQYYIQNERGAIGIVGLTLSIPPDPDNTDYQKYLAWLAEGNEPLPADN